MATFSCKGAGDVSPFLAWKNVITIKKENMDTERMTRKLLESSSYLFRSRKKAAACDKTTLLKMGDKTMSIFFILLSLNPSLKPQKETFGVGPAENPKWKTSSYSPGQGTAVLLLSSSCISLCWHLYIFLQQESRFLFEKELPPGVTFNVYQLFTIDFERVSEFAIYFFSWERTSFLGESEVGPAHLTCGDEGRYGKLHI